MNFCTRERGTTQHETNIRQKKQTKQTNRRDDTNVGAAGIYRRGRGKGQADQWGKRTKRGGIFAHCGLEFCSSLQQSNSDFALSIVSLRTEADALSDAFRLGRRGVVAQETWSPYSKRSLVENDVIAAREPMSARQSGGCGATRGHVQQIGAAPPCA